MSEKAYVEMTPEERAELRYVPLVMPELRAMVVAHAINLGQPPLEGAGLGFGFNISDLEVSDPNHVTPAELASAVPKTQKVWFHFTVAADDISAGIDLWKSRTAGYANRITQIALDPDFLKRLAASLENQP